MIAWLRCRLHRDPPPVPPVELPPIPQTTALPRTITRAARIRRQAEHLLATDRPIEEDIFPQRRNRRSPP